MNFNFNSIETLYIISGGILTWIISLFLHHVAFIMINYQAPEIEYNLEIKLRYILSPDFFFSRVYKKKLPKVRKKDYIININKLNLVFSLLIFLLLFFHDKSFNYFEITFLAYRTFSRVVEITYAFYKDITEDVPKTSTLKANERIKLAINSYFEIIVLYSYMYYLLDKVNTFFDSVVMSTSISTFTLGFGLADFNSCTIQDNFIKVIIITQIISTINIITLSIASYLGSANTNSNSNN